MSKTIIHDLWKRNNPPRTIGERVAMSLLETTWTAAPEWADDSHRGTYLTVIRGTALKISPPGGWHSMSIADDDATKAWRVIADAIDRAVELATAEQGVKA